MKRVNPTLKKNLSIWGDWVNEGIRGLGYARETPISRLRTSPGRSSFVMVIPRYFTNKVALEVQGAVNKLPLIKQDYLWLQYISKTKITIAAHALEVSVDDYRKGIQDAEQETAKLLNMRYFIYT